ncbi:MAG: hypothetical protein U9M92_02275 [Patescibacteria group bacterium]|nr:hypothetical protein [Patescibacteria group bacterium]
MSKVHKVIGIIALIVLAIWVWNVYRAPAPEGDSQAAQISLIDVIRKQFTGAKEAPAEPIGRDMIGSCTKEQEAGFREWCRNVHDTWYTDVYLPWFNNVHQPWLEARETAIAAYQAAYQEYLDAWNAWYARKLACNIATGVVSTVSLGGGAVIEVVRCATDHEPQPPGPPVIPPQPTPPQRPIAPPDLQGCAGINPGSGGLCGF